MKQLSLFTRAAKHLVNPLLAVLAGCLASSGAAEESPGKFESIELTEGGVPIKIQVAFQPGAVARHPVILTLGSLKKGAWPDWSTNLVRDAYLLAAFAAEHPPDPVPERRPVWLFFDERFAHSYVEGGRRAVADAARVIDWLIARPDVDPERIGWLGSSTTGIFGLSVAVREPRLKAIVAFVATGAYEEWLATWKPNGLWRGGEGGLWPETRALLPEWDPIHRADKLFPCATLLVSGSQDRIVDPASTRAFVNTARPYYQSDPGRLRFVVYEGSGHNLPGDVVQLYAEHWFRLYLNPKHPPPPPQSTSTTPSEGARRTAITSTPPEALVGATNKTNYSKGSTAPTPREKQPKRTP